ncbi:hypothetical protein Ac2012v2_005748 [Leucoagaricus gongylophorus]
MAACLRFTRRVWKSFIDNKGHDAQCFPHLRILRAIPGCVETSLKIEQSNTNRVGTGESLKVTAVMQQLTGCFIMQFTEASSYH